MESLTFEKKTYAVDEEGFLLDHEQWDEAFAEGIAPSLGMPDRLSEEQWHIIYFIRESYARHGKCPLVYEACRANGLRLKELQDLFPTGYLRGACKLAGVTYKEGFHGAVGLPAQTRDAASHAEKVGALAGDRSSQPSGKAYRVDIRGFLTDPDEWDEQYAVFKAYEMGMPESLTDAHWNVIRFIRERFKKDGIVPTVYETCEANHLDIEDLERLFPHGYHRGAVKIAGLRVR